MSASALGPFIKQPGKLLTGYYPSLRKYHGIAIGDSYTFSGGTGNLGTDHYSYLLQTYLRAQGALVEMRCYGIPGSTSSNHLWRCQQGMLTQFNDNISFGVIYSGENDVAYSTTVASASSSTVLTLQAGLGVSYYAGTYFILNGDGISRQITNVSTDTITFAPPFGGTPTGGMTVVIDTTRNITEIGKLFIAAGCANLIVLGLHMWNVSGGDTSTTQTTTNQALRTLQNAGATALQTLCAAATPAGSCVWINLYTYMAALIANSIPVTFSYNGVTTVYTFADSYPQWHSYSTNTHLNALGQFIITNLIFPTTPAPWAGITQQFPAAWLAAMQT